MNSDKKMNRSRKYFDEVYNLGRQFYIYIHTYFSSGTLAAVRTIGAGVGRQEKANMNRIGLGRALKNAYSVIKMIN